MAVLRQLNALGQMRVDVPHWRLTESSVAGDFDILAGRMIAGDKAVIIKGFTLVAAAIGTPATSIEIEVANGQLINYLASESGSIFNVPSNTANEILGSDSPKVVGNFTPSATNYIGIDLIRQVDDTTADLVQFFDPDTDAETAKQTPLARTLDYRIVISTADFNNVPGICAVAKVKTDANNNIETVEDARNILFRLGLGGTTPDTLASFTWPAGRNERLSSLGTSKFTGGDKDLNSLGSWMKAVMARVWEIGGGQYWYSQTADRNVKMFRATGSLFDNGETFEWDGTNLHWKAISFIFDNSEAFVNEVAEQTTSVVGLTDLIDGECIYVDLDRATDHTVAGANPLVAVKSSWSSLGGSSPPGSRYVIAWNKGGAIFIRDQFYAVNETFRTATHLTYGTVRTTLLNTSPSPSRAVAALDSTGVAIATGLTRDGGYTNGGAIAAGKISLGFGSNDTGVDLASTNITALQSGALEFTEVVDPSAPAANKAKLYLRDNGLLGLLNKTQVCVMWADGTTTVICEN